MKIHFGNIAFLILGVLFYRNPLAAAPAEFSRPPTPILLTVDPGTNQSQAMAAIRATETNVPAKASVKTSKNTNAPARIDASVQVTNALAYTNASVKDTNAPANVKTSITITKNTNAPARISTSVQITNAPAYTNASVKGTNAPAKSKALVKNTNNTNTPTNVKISITNAKYTNVSANISVPIKTANAADNTKELVKSTNAKASLKNTNGQAKLNASVKATNAPLYTESSLKPADTNASVNLESMETLDDKHSLAIGDRLSFRIEEDKHRLAFGDKLSVRVEDEPTPLLVTDSGELEVPYIGRFPAEKKTCKQLAFELKAALEKDYFYKATVILAVDLKTKSRGRVYLTGAVHMPGPQEIPSDEVLTLGKAILRAGGFTDFAERSNVKVTRKAGAGSSKTKTLVVDVAQVFDKGKTDCDLPLEPDDLILIPERVIRF